MTGRQPVAQREGRGRILDATVVLASQGGDDAAERVAVLLGRTTARMQQDPLLTEALTRAFMFADASAREEIRAVSRLLVTKLARAIRPGASG